MANAITSFFKAGEEIKRLTAALAESEKKVTDLTNEVSALTEANKTLSEENDNLSEQAVKLTADKPDVAKLTADLELAQHNLKAMREQHQKDLAEANAAADKRVAEAQNSAKAIAAAETRTTLAGIGIKAVEIKNDGTEATAVKAPSEASKLFGLDKVKAATKEQLTKLK